MRSYARDIGLIFQITDDLLDELGSTEKIGKTAGKDKNQGKATLVSLLGVDAAVQRPTRWPAAPPRRSRLTARPRPNCRNCRSSSQSRIMKSMFDFLAYDTGLESP